MPMELLQAMNGRQCQCGKVHRHGVQTCIGPGAIAQIAGFVNSFGAKKVFLLSDINTHNAAGSQVLQLLQQAQIPCSSYCFQQKHLEPDEASVGAAVMHYDASCDMIIAVGSGVINDIGKILSMLTNKPYMIVATAPSMDGYASASSSMTRNGLKISLPSRSPDVIVGDTQILCQAPLHMMKAGLGDMLAKYVSICEWRIAHIVAGEYYCEQIASLIRQALQRCIDQADGLMQRDPCAVQAVFEGLVIGGIAMNYAGLSRPASGAEHYISHILDMRAVEFGTSMDLHGIQCAIGTLICVRLYEKLRAATPDREQALNYAAAFDVEQWHRTLRAFLGNGAESMIALEQQEGKYDRSAHQARLDRILEHWDALVAIMDQELPSAAALETLLGRIQAPKTLSQIGVEESLLPLIFKATKDIRDKYVLSRLAWDLGLLDKLL